MENDLLERAADLVMDAGQTLLENGGEVFRVQQTMEIMAHSLGVRDFHVYVLTNGIFASASMGSTHNVSLIRHVPSVSIHLGRVEAINELSVSWPPVGWGRGSRSPPAAGTVCAPHFAGG